MWRTGASEQRWRHVSSSSPRRPCVKNDQWWVDEVYCWTVGPSGLKTWRTELKARLIHQTRAELKSNLGQCGCEAHRTNIQSVRLVKKRTVAFPKLTGSRLDAHPSACRLRRATAAFTEGWSLNGFSKQGNSVWITSHLPVRRKLK